MANTLLIFIRNPQLGKVKTRLARTMGDAEALRIYGLLLDRTRAAALGCDAERWLFYSDFVPDSDDWSPAYFLKRLQVSSDLGQRMHVAFEQAFQNGASKAVIIGSDCPELDGAALNQAFQLLDSADFVIGPAPDGGYYLLGMKAPEASVFQGIEWSTEFVLANTLEKINTAGKTVALLPMRLDVDTEADWRMAGLE